MSKNDENKVNCRLKVLSQIESSSKATNRAIQRVRDSLINEEKNRQGASTRIWRNILKSPITKFAAAAIIIVAIGIVVLHRRPIERIEPPEILEVKKSPAQLTTFASLTFAYRRGGIAAVEEQCDKVFKMVGPRPATISIQELLAEFNGT